MKRIIILMFIALPFFASSQIDSATDFKTYGSLKERSEQESLQRQSKHNHLVRYIGFTSFWANELSMYLQDLNYSADIDYKGNTVFYKFTKNSVGNLKAKKAFTVAITSNAKDRITAFKISGDKWELIKLFISYWPTCEEYPNDESLKDKTIAYKHLIDEKITLRNENGIATITVTKVK